MHMGRAALMSLVYRLVVCEPRAGQVFRSQSQEAGAGVRLLQPGGAVFKARTAQKGQEPTRGMGFRFWS
jgi:hypothetical protein